MAGCTTYSENHDGMGTSQTDRFLSALSPDYFQLEERNAQDFIFFAQKLSAYLDFYNENNVVDGDWTSFFQNESTSILIYIAYWQTDLFQNNYNALKKNAAATFPSQTIESLIAQIESEFLSKLEKCSYLDEEISAKENLLSLSESILEKLNFIKEEITKSAHPEELVGNYNFDKNMQQIFGMLLSWKKTSENAITFQLENYDKHSPHFTLFLSFLKLLSIAQQEQNNFTKRHLDFYYKEVLKTELQAAKPDFVHLIIEPQKSTAFLLPKKTMFQAGKNSAGIPKYYEAISDYTINEIKLKSIFTTFDEDQKRFKADLLSTINQNIGIDLFTETAEIYNEGIGIASPLLLMQTGERTIKIELNAKKYSADQFDYFITGEKKWLKIENAINDGNLLELKISSKEKSVVPFNAEIHTDFQVESNFPMLLIFPKSANLVTTISSITLTIKVENSKSFKLESDFGSINIEKPFYPFGEIPKTGNGITFSCNEFFIKKNAVANFTILDENDSADYFQTATNRLILDNSVYKSKSLSNLTNSAPILDYQIDKISDASNLYFGKFRIELTDITFNEESYMQNYLTATKNILDGAKTENILPGKPQITRFAFGYEATEKINLLTRKDENNLVDILQIFPFGFQKLKKGQLKFSPFENLKGALFLGFENAEPKDSFAFLIQLEEGTANPKLAPATITWNYLSNNSWVNFPAQNIHDDTKSFSQSGLVNVTLPDYQSDTNTLLQSDIFWLKASVSNVGAVCNLIGIHPQAMKAMLSSNNETIEFTENTPKETISKLVISNNNVKNIKQPYPSFGGKLKEADENLYERTSERLRHKNRAITSWDFERLILQEFPEVYSVKCLNHYRYDSTISNVSAGYVTLIPIAKSTVVKNIYWKPLLSLLTMININDYVSKIASPHSRICVKTPVLEKIELNFKVKFHKTEGMDSSLYIKELKDTINAFLSPWSVENTDLQFVHDIEFSSLIQLIDNKYYVDYLTDFSVSQYRLNDQFQNEGNAIQSLYKISPQTDFSLFVPNDSHTITEIY